MNTGLIIRLSKLHRPVTAVLYTTGQTIQGSIVDVDIGDRLVTLQGPVGEEILVDAGAVIGYLHTNLE